MNPDAELDPPFRRDAGVALGHAVLHVDRAPHRVDDAAKLDDDPVAGALDDPAVVRGDGGVDQVAAQRPQARQRALLIGAGEPAEADDIGDQDRRDLARFRHGAALRFGDATTNGAAAMRRNGSPGERNGKIPALSVRGPREYRTARFSRPGLSRRPRGHTYECPNPFRRTPSRRRLTAP